MKNELNFPPNVDGLVRGGGGGGFAAVSTPIFAGKYSLELGKLSPRSTQCTPLHRSSISTFQPKIVNIFSQMKNEFPIFSFSAAKFCVESCIFLRIFDEILSGFRDKFQKRVTCVAFSIKFAKTSQKFAENSEFCENYSLL